MNASGASHVTGSSLGLPDSWSFHSHLQLSGEQPSWMTSQDELAHTRISVGAFMGARTEALGSLDGDRHTPRVSLARMSLACCWLRDLVSGTYVQVLHRVSWTTEIWQL